MMNKYNLLNKQMCGTSSSNRWPENIVYIVIMINMAKYIIVETGFITF